ncbi:hypothetical protein BKA65DRAFT_595791 [Rhexocercosporidium sp. MPI-PUGE-AT-0058]|nr:hypothetical protein BKA65DRAFT_595791 [Rhexocercosporidium sp. MPI-PUGE-AT-0058]
MSITIALKKTLTKGSETSKRLLVALITLPYYRFFRQNTLLPVLHIAECVQRGDSDAEIVKALAHWRERKLYEQHFIQLASTILAAAVIGCFSWVPATNGFWIGPALWYSSLVLSIVAILLSSSQAFIFSALNTPSVGLNSSGDFRRYLSLILVVPPRAILPEGFHAESLRGCGPRWKMVFTWQAPMMLMAYAVIFFMAGLTVYVCTPLFNGEARTDGGKMTKTPNVIQISIFYLAMSAFTGGIFVYCSFWAYRFIDLDRYETGSEAGEVLPRSCVASPLSTQLQSI